MSAVLPSIVPEANTITNPRMPPPVRGAQAVRRYVQFFANPIACIREMYREHGAISAIGPILPNQPVHRLEVICVGPELNKQVLGDPVMFRTTGQTLRGPAGSAQRRVRYGLTRMQGPQHKQHRAMLMPPFHRRAVQGYHELMVKTAAEVLAQWQPGATADLYRAMRILALRLASTVLFTPDPRESHEVGSMIEGWLTQNFSWAVWLLPLPLPGTPYYRMLKHAERLEKLLLSMIEARRRNPEGRTDVLSILTQARDEESHGMTNTELVGESAILFGASYETTASTLTWILFLLIQHPEILRDLVDELEGELRGEAPTQEQLARLTLLDRVTKESMRILPPVPYTIRATTGRVWMGGYRVPHGSRVVCSHYMTHHLPELYPQPERFLPDRWLTIEPTQYEYLPFSAGPRACIGAMFAIQAMKISLAMMLQNFRLEIIHGARVDRVVRVTMSPRHGLPVKIHAQDHQFAASEVHGNIHEMVRLS